MQEHLDRALDDVALSAFIDDELADADAEKVRARLATDARFAHRFDAMIRVTAAIRAAYCDAFDLVGVVAAVYARVIREACDDRCGDPSATEPTAGPRMREVDLAVAGLTSEQRVALCLAVLGDLSYLEIAAALHLPDCAVMVRVAEARAALATSLGESLLARAHAAGTTRH